MSDSLETRLKQLIIDALMLDDITVEDIVDSEPLFVEGLGLDSIDALELAMAIHKEFGVKTSAEDEKNKENFYSIDTLSAYIRRELEAAEQSE